MGPRNPKKSARNDGTGPPRYRRTVLGNHWISKSGWGTGWPPLRCPSQNVYFQYKMPPKGPPRTSIACIGNSNLNFSFGMLQASFWPELAPGPISFNRVGLDKGADRTPTLAPGTTSEAASSPCSGRGNICCRLKSY